VLEVYHIDFEFPSVFNAVDSGVYNYVACVCIL